MKKMDDKIENLEKEVKYHIIELEENVDEHISPIIEDTKNSLHTLFNRVINVSLSSSSALDNFPMHLTLLYEVGILSIFFKL